MAVNYTDGYDGINVGTLIGNLNSFGAEVVAEFESNEARLDAIEAELILIQERLDALEAL